MITAIEIYRLAARAVNAKRRRGVRASFEASGLAAEHFDAYRDAYERALDAKREAREDAYRAYVTWSVR